MDSQHPPPTHPKRDSCWHGLSHDLFRLIVNLRLEFQPWLICDFLFLRSPGGWWLSKCLQSIINLVSVSRLVIWYLKGSLLTTWRPVYKGKNGQQEYTSPWETRCEFKMMFASEKQRNDTISGVQSSECAGLVSTLKTHSTNFGLWSLGREYDLTILERS